MASTKANASCAKVLLAGFNCILWFSGLALLAFGVWMRVDPRRNFLLDLVHFTEDDPLLRVAVFIFMGIGALTVIVGIFGCCATFREVQCLLAAHIVLLTIILFGEITAGAISILFKDKMNRTYGDKFFNMTHHFYGRVYYIDDIVDRIQYWRQCCGSNGPQDFNGSWWQINKSVGSLEYVPPSCCAQNIDAWSDNLKPVDTEACVFRENAGPARYTTGCKQKILSFLNDHAAYCIALAFSLAALQICGILLSLWLCRSIRL